MGPTDRLSPEVENFHDIPKAENLIGHMEMAGPVHSINAKNSLEIWF